MIVVAVIVAACVAFLLVTVGVLLGHAAASRSARRGGMLELDTPAGRAAIADPDDWFDAGAFRARSRQLGFEPFAGGGDDRGEAA